MQRIANRYHDVDERSDRILESKLCNVVQGSFTSLQRGTGRQWEKLMEQE